MYVAVADDDIAGVDALGVRVVRAPASGDDAEVLHLHVGGDTVRTPWSPLEPMRVGIRLTGDRSRTDHAARIVNLVRETPRSTERAEVAKRHAVIEKRVLVIQRVGLA